jgi:hypothetical protein
MKDIPGYKGRYGITEDGKVWSHITSQYLILGQTCSTGAYRVTLYNSDLHPKGKTYLVHRLVAKTYIPNLENKPYVGHKNGIVTDNRIDNLEWITTEQADKPLKIRCIDTNQVYPSIQEVARVCNISAGNIVNCCKKLRKTVGGFRWEYA